MKIISWNVNGIRACLKKGFEEFVSHHSPDIMCIQETKADQSQVDLDIKPYEMLWNSAERKGYSGTLIISKKKIRDVKYGIGIEKHDNEGRVITIDLGNIFVVNVYVPNSGSDRKDPLKRLDYRTQEWDVDFLNYLKSLAKKKPVIACGDFNVAHQEIDIANPTSNKGNSGFTDEERESFSNFLSEGFVDVFREKNSSSRPYTWWSYMSSAYKNNTGWRIDYFLASRSILPLIHSEEVLISPPDDLGERKSDHSPIKIEVDI